MTPIDDMPAGPELDRLIARTVMGIEAPELRIGQPRFGRVSMAPQWEPKPYSMHIAAAWEALEKVRTSPQIFHVDVVSMPSPPHPPSVWRVFILDNQDKTFDGEAETAPLAICRAALKAIEHAKKA